jgi:hypothetical protein
MPDIFGSRSSRYNHFGMFLLFSGMFASAFSIITKDDWYLWILLVNVCVAQYCFLCWSGLYTGKVNNHKYIARSWVALGLVATLVFLCLGSALAGRNQVELILSPDLALNKGLWLGSSTTAAFMAITQVMAVAELYQGLKQATLASPIGNWKFKYRCFSFMLVILSNLPFVVLTWLGIMVYGLTGWREFDLATDALRNPFLLLTFLLEVAIVLADKKLLGLYQMFQEYRARCYIHNDHLRWLVDRIGENFETPLYQYEPFEYSLQDSSLSILDDILLFIREAREEIGVEVISDKKNWKKRNYRPSSVSLDSEAKAWQLYLQLKTPALITNCIALKTQVDVELPRSLTNLNIWKETSYYTNLAKKLRQAITH